MIQWLEQASLSLGDRSDAYDFLSDVKSWVNLSVQHMKSSNYPYDAKPYLEEAMLILKEIIKIIKEMVKIEEKLVEISEVEKKLLKKEKKTQ